MSETRPRLYEGGVIQLNDTHPNTAEVRCQKHGHGRIEGGVMMTPTPVHR